MKFLSLLTLIGLTLLSLGACIMDSDPLEGTSWVLLAYGNTNPIPGRNVTMMFEDGQVRGSGGCNSYSGPYQVHGDQITFDQVGMTLMACPEPLGLMEQETAFMQFLGAAQTFSLEKGQLKIFRSDGEALTFVPEE